MLGTAADEGNAALDWLEPSPPPLTDQILALAITNDAFLCPAIQMSE